MNAHHVLERPEATSKSIDDLLRDIRLGKVRIPQFQRNFRWDQKDIRNLFDSIYRGYPIGNLLFWDTDQHEGSTTELGPLSFTPAKRDAVLVVDGQQRLVSFAGVLLRDPADDRSETRKFKVYFDLRERKFVNPKAQQSAPSHWLPLSEVADTLRYLQWLRNLPQTPEREDLVEAADQVARAVRDYRVPVYIVHSAGEADLRNIFERLNSGGKPLKAFQIFNAIHGRRGGDLKTLRQELECLDFGSIAEPDLLKVVGALLNLDISRDLDQNLKRIRSDKVQDALPAVHAAMVRVIEFLKEDARIPHVTLLPYKFPLVPLARYFDLTPEPSKKIRRDLSSWLWRGACSGKHRSAQSQDIRFALKLISEGSVEQLVSQFADIHEFDFSVWEKYSIKGARTQLLCNGLISSAPKNLVSGEDIEATKLLNDAGTTAFQRILPPKNSAGTTVDPKRTSSLANRLFHPQIKGMSVVDMLLSEPGEEILETHAISREMIRDLTSPQDWDRFLLMRGEELERRISSFLKDRCSFS